MSRSLFIATLLATAGCAATQKPISNDESAMLAGKRLAVVVSKPPPFTAMTAGKAMFGLLGSAAMTSAGNALVAQHHVEDPALKLSRELAGVLVQRFGVVVAGEPALGESDDVEQLAAERTDADLALVVRTTFWSFSYFPTDWSHYRVNYGVKAALVDLRTRKVLAQGEVRRTPDRTPDAPTYDELLASDAARLKAELQKVSDDCYRDLVQGSWKL